jgi:hypothetical protein
LLDIPIEGEPSTPNSLAWLDAGLAVLVDTPLDQTSRVATVLMLSGHSRWEAQIRRFAAKDTTNALSADILAELITPEQFPFLAPAVAAGALSASAADPLEFGFLRILDGVEQHIAEVGAGRTGTIAAPDPDLAFAKDERVRNARDKLRDAEAKVRDLRKKEREAIAKARERARD